MVIVYLLLFLKHIVLAKMITADPNEVRPNTSASKVLVKNGKIVWAKAEPIKDNNPILYLPDNNK